MSGLDRMKIRADYNGYDLHDKIAVNNKYRSFKSALRTSYQAEWITLNKGTDEEKKWRCLINPSRLTENFDKKIISIDFESGIQEGTIFWWDRTKKYWMVNLQQHTEEAYFRGSITRADYEIDIDGRHYLAIARGPVEETTEWQMKHQIIFNNLNYSLVLQIVKNSQTVNYFKRHQKVKIKLSYPDVETGEIIEEFHNWKVVATDKYSSDFLIDIYLKEWHDNEMEDNKIDTEVEREEEQGVQIEGPLIVNGYDTDLLYSINGCETGEWKVNSNKVKIIKSDEKSCTLEILTGKSMTFILTFENNFGFKIEQEIIVKSL